MWASMGREPSIDPGAGWRTALGGRFSIGATGTTDPWPADCAGSASTLADETSLRPLASTAMTTTAVATAPRAISATMCLFRDEG
jgi:hypothetical protein